MRYKYKGIKFKPLLSNNTDVVNTIVGSKRLPLYNIRNEFKRIFMKYRLMGYSSFEDFTEVELYNICNLLCSMLNINYVKIFCEVVGSNEQNENCYLCINIPLPFILGAGFDIKINHTFGVKSGFGFDDVYSEISIYRFRQNICALCSCVNSSPYGYVGVGLSMDGKLGFILSHSNSSDFFHHHSSFHPYLSTSYCFIEFLP